MRVMYCAAVLGAMAPGAMGFLLTNGDLELGSGQNDATGWSLVEPDVDVNLDPVNSADFTNFANHTPTGNRGLWLRSFEGSLNVNAPEFVDAILSQEVPGVAGALYELSAWFFYEQHYSGGEAGFLTQTLLAIAFLDAGDGVIGVSQVDIDDLQANDRVWRQFSVQGVAPAGTVKLRVGMAMIGGQVTPENPQSAFVDDFVLVPAPGAAGVVMVLGVGVMARRRR